MGTALPGFAQNIFQHKLKEIMEIDMNSRHDIKDGFSFAV